jgi:hypothetical protein
MDPLGRDQSVIRPLTAVQTQVATYTSSGIRTHDLRVRKLTTFYALGNVTTVMVMGTSEGQTPLFLVELATSGRT